MKKKHKTPITNCLIEHFRFRLKNIISVEVLKSKEKQRFRVAKTFHSSEKAFEKYDVKNPDHCHCTVKYQDATHQDCNTNYKELLVPIVGS